MHTEVIEQQNRRLEALEYENLVLLEKMKEMDDNAKRSRKELEEANRNLYEENENLRHFCSKYLAIMKNKDVEIKDLKLKLKAQLQINEAKKEQRESLKEVTNENNNLKEEVEELQSEVKRLQQKSIRCTDEIPVYARTESMQSALDEKESMQKELDEKEALIRKIENERESEARKSGKIIAALKQMNHDKSDEIRQFKEKFERFSDLCSK